MTITNVESLVKRGIKHALKERVDRERAMVINHKITIRLSGERVQDIKEALKQAIDTIDYHYENLQKPDLLGWVGCSGGHTIIPGWDDDRHFSHVNCRTHTSALISGECKYKIEKV